MIEIGFAHCEGQYAQYREKQPFFVLGFDSRSIFLLYFFAWLDKKFLFLPDYSPFSSIHHMQASSEFQSPPGAAPLDAE